MHTWLYVSVVLRLSWYRLFFIIEAVNIGFCWLRSSHTQCLRHTHIGTSNKNFILKYFRCRDGKRTETRIGMEGICITHSCIPVYMQHIMAHSGGMQECVIQIPSIPILVSVLFPSLHLKYFRMYSFYAHAHETTPTSGYKLSHNHIVVEARMALKCWLWSVPFLPSP